MAILRPKLLINNLNHSATKDKLLDACQPVNDRLCHVDQDQSDRNAESPAPNYPRGFHARVELQIHTHYDQ